MRLTVSGNDTTPGPNADSPGTGGSGGGGGAPGFWFLGALVLLTCIQKLTTRRRHSNNSSSHRHRAALLAVTLSLFTLHAAPFSAPLKAQQTTAASDDADDADDPGEVITMSAFEVRSESVKGYQASESVTGTRVASLLRELPFNVNVVTSEFIADFNALELSDQLANVSSFSPSENIGQYQLRGYQASTQLVDGFRRVGLTGVTVTDRVEVIKGPAASIYGAIQPGGAVNTLRKKPAATPKYGITAGFGNNGQARASFYATGPVGSGKKLFYRVDTEYRTARRQQDFAKTRNEYAAVQLLYKPTPRTTIGLFIDHADRHDYNTYQMVTAAVNLDTTNAPSWLPYSLDTYQRYYAKTYTQYFGMDYDYYNFNLLGPNANRHNRLTAGSLTLDHKFSNAWSLRASLNTSYNPTHGEKASATYYPFGESSVSADTATPPPASVKLTPQHDEGMTKATGFQLDNLFRFATGPVRHQFLVTTDYYRNSDQSTSIQWPASMYYDPLDPWSTRGAYSSFDYPTWEENPSNYTVYSTNAKTISRDYGLFLSERATMFNGRLIAMIGGRYDYVDSTAEHKPTEDDPTAKKADYNVDAWTYQAGLTAILTRHIALYANASTAFDPQPQLDENDDPLPNIESKGYEFGVKLTLLQERLNITLNRFDIRQKNLVTSVTDAITQEKEVILTGEQVAKGYEIDFNWQLTRSLNIVGGYGLVDAKITDAGKLNWMNDTTPRRVPKHNLGASIRYEFVTGKLKGLFAIAGVTYYSKSLVNLGSGKSLVPYTGAPTVSGLQGNQIHNLRFPNGGLPYPYLPENAIITYYDSATKYLYWTDNPAAATTADLTKYSYADPYMSGISYVLDGREQNYNRASTVWKAGIGYKFRSGARKTRTSHKIQINMDNIFNEKSTLAGGIPILKRTLMATYSVTF
jgi:outer membrane receptor protein involved in Fe transport